MYIQDKTTNATQDQVELSSFQWRVMVNGELMFLESYSNCDVTNTVTPIL